VHVRRIFGVLEGGELVKGELSIGVLQTKKSNKLLNVFI
jgi:hypothetical protein